MEVALIALNEMWWKHLTPKGMHRKLRDVETLLRQWCDTEYGRHWLENARRPGGVIRLKTGQFIPVLHINILGDMRTFSVPPTRLRDEHRMVGHDSFLSGRALDDGEVAASPHIRIDLVEDAAMLAAVARGQSYGPIHGVKEPALVFSAPAHLLISPETWPKKAYVLYQHIFGDGTSYPEDGYFYVGVTTRSWQRRWAEHRRAAEFGSPLLFHRKLREERAAGRVTYIHHKVMAVTDDLERLYATEEWLVEGHWKDGRRLNMIPGGKSGLRYLRENGMLAARAAPEPDERDRLVESWLRENPRRGLPAPWVSEKWKDDAWAVAQICGRDDRLSIDQVRAIRDLARNATAEEIADRIGARNKEQVQRVIDGETYARVI